MFNVRKSGAEAPPSPKSDQKRQSYRASIEFPIVYNVDGREGTRSASANDLSVGGLRLLGDEDFTKDTVIDFRFTLPTSEVKDVFIEKEIAGPRRSASASAGSRFPDAVRARSISPARS